MYVLQRLDVVESLRLVTKQTLFQRLGDIALRIGAPKSDEGPLGHSWVDDKIVFLL